MNENSKKKNFFFKTFKIDKNNKMQPKWMRTARNKPTNQQLEWTRTIKAIQKIKQIGTLKPKYSQNRQEK